MKLEPLGQPLKPQHLVPSVLFSNSCLLLHLLLAFPNELQVQSCLMASFAAGLADPWKTKAADVHDECNDKI